MSIDWRTMLIPSTSLLELVLRGSAMYLVIFAIMRIFRRNAGSLNTADLLVLVLVADAAQNGMAGEYHSLTEGVVLVATIFAWNYLIDWLSFRFPAMRRLLSPPPVPLVVDGRIQAARLRGEMLTRDDLMEQLRELGVGSLREVKRCWLEADGHLSVLRTDRQEPGKRKTDVH